MVILSIRCFVYNHEPYLRQCLDGFVKQKTNFAFEAIIHDDASTDNSAAIIREYAEKYPGVIKPIYETENQYSKHDGSLHRIMDLAISPTVKYLAICEGDDYWIDPLKLQKQVDFLESHPDYTMICTRCKRYSVSEQRFKSDSYCLSTSAQLLPEKIITCGGLYISTCSMVYRKSVTWSYPSYCVNCHVGDYPLQIMCAMKGKCYYLNENTSVYRIDNCKSWVGHLHKLSLDAKLRGTRTEIDMLKGFSIDYPQFKKSFLDRIAFFINLQLRKPTDSPENELIKKEFSVELKKYTFFWKWHLRVRTSNNKLFYYIFYKLFGNYLIDNFYESR